MMMRMIMMMMMMMMRMMMRMMIRMMMMIFIKMLSNIENSASVLVDNKIINMTKKRWL